MKIAGILSSGLAFIFLTGCSGKTARISSTAAPESRYNSDFPFAGGSTKLESASRSVLKVYYVAYFKTYEFREESRITPARLKDNGFSKMAVNTTLSPRTLSATGTVISDMGNRVALLTCAHIFEVPDTMITWYEGNLQPPNAFIRYLSICERKDIFVKTISEWGPFNLLAIDPDEDVAIIGRLCEGKSREIDIFPFKIGNARELAWGNTVFVLSYPLGTLMATRGMVSNPGYDAKGTFLVDAVINRGSSGGIVLAVTNQPAGFELVGMLKSAFSSDEYFLKPEKDVFETRYDENAPYRGEIYVGSEERINYGVTPVIPASVIRSFYKKNREELIRTGYNLDGLFQP